MYEFDMPRYTDAIAREIATGTARANRPRMHHLRRRALKLGYTPEQAQRLIEDTCELANLYRFAR